MSIPLAGLVSNARPDHRSLREIVAERSEPERSKEERSKNDDQALATLRP